MKSADGPLRVLVLFTNLNRGGAETMVMNYLRRMDRTAVVFDFVVFRDVRGDYEEEAERLGSRIFRLPALRPGGVGRHRRAVVEFFDAHPEYDMVHGHCSELGYFVYREAARRGLRFIAAHAHNVPRGWDAKTPLREVLKRLTRRHLTHFFGCSAESSRWLFGRRLAVGALFLPNAIDAGEFAFDAAKRAAVREREGWNGRFVVGHVGRFSAQKNHRFLIDVFERVLRRESSALLVLVGSGGEMERRVKDMITRRGLAPNVVFAGSRADIAQLLQGFDLFLFPSRFEGLSVAMVEAQAAGLRVVTSTAVPADCTVIADSVESLPLSAGPDDWAAKVLDEIVLAKHDTASENKHRKDRRSDIVAAGFDITDNAKWLENFYLEASTLSTPSAPSARL
jgi:glycosyltransferase involved in cell wall biosynthesis